jgi:hypothetical protein
VTVTPGSNATSSCNTGIAPTPETITVSATNVALPVTSNVVILSYGCQYQGGFLYSVNDTTNNGVTGACTAPPCAGSIGGKVAATSDQTDVNGIIWSSNGASGSSNYSFDIIPGIDETSTSTPSNQSPDYNAFLSMFNYPSNFSGTYTNAVPTPALTFSVCDGSTNGYCNTQNIALFYNKYQTNYSTSCNPQNGGSGGCTATEPTQPATSLAFYAAGLCTSYTGGGFTDWYLPAICEMGPDSGGNICSTTNVEQNMVDNLSFLLSNTVPCTTPSGCLAGHYWSSTEYSVVPQLVAWVESFASGGGSYQDGGDKLNQLGARCSRALTL